MERRNVSAAGMTRPKGYEDAVLLDGAKQVLVLGGHVAFDAERKILHAGDVVAQMRVTLGNIKATLHAAGFHVSDLVKLTIHVTDVALYRAKLAELGHVWREVFGKHYPAMTLLGVRELMEPGSVLEIDGIAAR
jgi:enamine deaminase RidA (YjgF/YER057c/UK114 family)